MNGYIFVFGGDNSGGVGTWEIRNQGGALVSSGSLAATEDGATAALQSTTNVLIVGGATNPYTWLLYSPTGSLVSSGSMSNDHAAGHSQTHF